MLRTLALVLSTAALALPALAQEADFPGVFDETYEGSASFEVFPTGGGARLQHDSGTAQAGFARAEDGTITLSASAESPANGGIGFEMVFEGATETGWRGFTPDGMSELTRDGRILSIGMSDGYLNTLWGEAGKETLSITLRRTPAGAVPDAPEGDYEMVFTFDLAMAEPAVEGEARETTSDCARIITQTRVIANPGGGAMNMIMVPVCVPG